MSYEGKLCAVWLALTVAAMFYGNYDHVQTGLVCSTIWAAVSHLKEGA